MIAKIPMLIKYLLLSLLLLSSLAQAEISTTYYVPDASGSPIAATDEQGNLKWRKHYRPYGEEINPGPAARHNHIGYTGHVQDASTGLTYMGARYYNPIIGRMNGMDPAPVNPADPRTFNRYAYAHNSPYTYVDPDGRNALIFWGVGVGLMLADMASNDPVPGHEQDGIAPVITMPGPMKLGGKVVEEVAEQGGKIGAKKGLGGNPFKGKTPAQIDDTFRKKGFDVKGTDPAAGKGSYINPKTGRKYYIDKGGKYKKGTELPHVDVHRPSSSSLPKKKLPLGDRLIE